jgi:hypothetical protein
MQIRNLLATAGMTAGAICAVLPAAHAQTVTVTKTNVGGNYQFLVNVAPTSTVNTIVFDFDGNVSYLSNSGTPFTTPYLSTTGSNDSFTMFVGPQTFSNETFTFAPAIGSTANTYSYAVAGIYASNAFAAAGKGTLAAAPEPSEMVSLSILAGCLVLGIAARRRVTCR